MSFKRYLGLTNVGNQAFSIGEKQITKHMYRRIYLDFLLWNSYRKILNSFWSFSEIRQNETTYYIAAVKKMIY